MKNLAYKIVADIRDPYGREEFLRPEARPEAALLKSLGETGTIQHLVEQRERLVEIEEWYASRKSRLSWIHLIAYVGFGLFSLGLFTISAASLIDGFREGEWIFSPSASVLGVIAGLGLCVEIFLGFLIDLGVLRKELMIQQLTAKRGDALTIQRSITVKKGA